MAANQTDSRNYSVRTIAKVKVMTLPELIAIEVMNAIERERRINKDDLIMAAEVAIGKYERERQPLMVAEPTDESLARLSTQQMWNNAWKEMMRIDSQKGGGFEFYVNEPMPTGVPPSFTGALTTASNTAAVTIKPGCISSAEAAEKAGFLNQAAPVRGQSLASMIDEARQRLIAKQQQAAALREYQGVQIVNDRIPTGAFVSFNATPADVGLGCVVTTNGSSVQQYEIYGDTTWVKTKSTT